MKAKRFLSLLLALVMTLGLLVTGVSAETVNNSAKTAVGISVNIPYADDVADGQNEFYAKVHVPADGYVSLTFNDLSSGTEPSDYSSWETIFYTSALDSMVGFGNKAGESKTFDPVGLPEGEYYVRVIGHMMPENSRFQIIVNYTQSGDWETELNDDWNSADRMSPNAPIHGSIMEGGDRDCFKLVLSDPGMVTFKLDHTFEGTTDSYWSLELLDSSLGPLHSYEFHGNISGEESAVPIGLPAGEFYLRMSRGGSSTTSEYVLTAQQDTDNVAEQELNDTFGTATPISTDVTVHGSLQNSGDKDYYQFGYMEEYTTGINVQFDHANLSDNHGYWRISLYDAGMTQIYSQTVSGLGDSVTLPTIGIYGGLRFICVEATNNYYSAEPYTFTVTEAGDIWEQEQNNSFADAWKNTLQLDESMKGCSMTTSDTDYFLLRCPSGGLMLNFDHPVLETSSGGWNVTIYDARQNQIAAQYYAAKESGGVLQGGIGLLDGEYYVAVSPSQIGPETYTITPWMDAANWEHETNNTRDSSASPLLDDTNTTRGNLSSAGDVDYYWLQPGEPGVLELSFDHANLQNTSGFWRLELYDAQNDVTLWSTTVSGMGDSISWKPIGMAAGAYFLKVSCNNSNSFSNATYTLHPVWTPSDEWEQEYNNPMSMPTEIQPGKTYSGGLMNSSDQDWYSFTISDPAAFDFWFNYPQVENGSGTWNVVLYTDSGTELTRWTYNEKDAPAGEHIVGLNSGGYQICVSSPYSSAYSDATYFLTLLTPDGEWERERNDDAAYCTIMELEDLGTAVRRGNLMTITDKDWYRLDVPEDGYIRLDFQHPDLNDKDHSYWGVALYGSDKTTLMASRTYYGTSGGEEPWDEIGVQAGSYYVCISDPSYNYGNYYNRDAYSFAVDYVASDSHENEWNGTLATAREIRTDQAYWGNSMTTGDQDYYTFTLDEPAGVYVHFLQPENTNGQWQVDLLNNKGTSIKSWTYQGWEEANFNEMGVGLPAGQYYVQVQRSGGSSSWSAKSYALQVNRSLAFFEQEVNDTRANATPMDLDTPMSGTLMTVADVDYYKFTLLEPTAVRLNLEHPADMTNASQQMWRVTLYNGTEEISYDSNSWYGDPDKDSDARWIGLDAGTYLVSVRDPANNYGNYWNGGVYTLTAETDDSLWEREQNNSYETANELPLNQDIFGVAKGSSDYYKIDVPRTGFVTLHFRHDVIDDTSTLWTIYLYDDEFNQMASFSSKGNTPGDLTTKGIGLAAGEYYVVVDSSNSSLVYTLQAEFSTDGLWEHEKNNSFGMANTLPLNQTLHGSLMSTIDVDYYKFQITEPGRLDLQFTHPKIMENNSYWRLGIYDAEQNHVLSWYPTGMNTDLTKGCLGLAPGVYYLYVDKYSSNYYSDYVYELTAHFTAANDWEQEQNNTSATANPISVNTAMHGLIMQSTDLDYYTFTLPAPDTVALSLQHDLVDTTSSIFTAYLIDENGNSKLSLSSKGLTAAETRSAAVNLDAGTYYVYVTGTNYTTPYTFTVHTYGANLAKITTQPADLTGPYGASGSFAVGASGSGLSYQWQYSTNGGENWRNTGNGRSTLPRTISTVNDGWLFRCVVTDVWGTSATSDPAAIRLIPTELKITSQPKNASVQPNEEASFVVQATGDELLYQWEQSADGQTWKPVSGATDSSLTVTASPSKTTMQYRCVITDIYEHSVITSAAKLTVALPELKITAQPEDCSGSVGENATFRVGASGEELEYQWQYRENGGTKWKNSTNTSAVAVVRITAARDGRVYRCVITDAYGRTVTSGTAVLHTQELFRILEHPEDVDVVSGTAVDFFVAAAGEDLTYQWQYKTSTGSSWKNSVSTGNNTETLSISATVGRAGYQFRCKIQSGGETLYSNIATLTVLGIKTQPTSVSTTAGTAVTMKVVATGKNLSYQWQYKTPSGSWKNSVGTGNTTDTLKISATTGRANYQFRCIVTDGAGKQVISNAATLTVFGIKTQPKDVSAKTGDNVTFTLVATGSGLTYQWQYKTPSGNWTNSPATGNKTATLKVPATASRNGYQYRCIITDAAGNTLNSNAATLTVG